ncbi:hypothetical protein I7I50_09241 [Histoplasma capsulatum G186AR]|nr:hypothetical protein I7I52_06762 [Histoplasma capsulatum]QSS74177.1 hypothetical protein I7I50_09241 [Histoplasma capsulatum G186AR]
MCNHIIPDAGDKWEKPMFIIFPDGEPMVGLMVGETTVLPARRLSRVLYGRKERELNRPLS